MSQIDRVKPPVLDGAGHVLGGTDATLLHQLIVARMEVLAATLADVQRRCEGLRKQYDELCVVGIKIRNEYAALASCFFPEEPPRTYDALQHDRVKELLKERSKHHGATAENTGA